VTATSRFKGRISLFLDNGQTFVFSGSVVTRHSPDDGLIVDYDAKAVPANRVAMFPRMDQVVAIKVDPE
jgi:hypothetical protein